MLFCIISTWHQYLTHLWSTSFTGFDTSQPLIDFGNKSLFSSLFTCQWFINSCDTPHVFHKLERTSCNYYKSHEFMNIIHVEWYFVVISCASFYLEHVMSAVEAVLIDYFHMCSSIYVRWRFRSCYLAW